MPRVIEHLLQLVPWSRSDPVPLLANPRRVQPAMAAGQRPE